ncbi:MAG: hypothetical protein ACREHD_33115, partial [Pirellulales bacterium]
MTNTFFIDLVNRHASRVIRVLSDLSRAGWSPRILPSGARLKPNRPLIELRAPSTSQRRRVSLYQVGHRGESHRLDERRIEITKTYLSGLPRLKGWNDVVLGYDPDTDAYVGLDPERLRLGGSTHNASSYVDPSALRKSSTTRIAVRPHDSRS